MRGNRHHGTESRTATNRQFRGGVRVSAPHGLAAGCPLLSWCNRGPCPNLVLPALPQVHRHMPTVLGRWPTPWGWSASLRAPIPTPATRRPSTTWPRGSLHPGGGRLPPGGQAGDRPGLAGRHIPGFRARTPNPLNRLQSSARPPPRAFGRLSTLPSWRDILARGWDAKDRDDAVQPQPARVSPHRCQRWPLGLHDGNARR